MKITPKIGPKPVKSGFQKWNPKQGRNTYKKIKKKAPFIIFFGGLVYLKIPQKINEILNKLITDIKNEIDESEKLRTEAKILLDNAQKKLDTAQSVGNEILKQAKKDSDKLVIELNDKFHKTSEIKKNLTENKIGQMKEAAIKDIKDASIKIEKPDWIKS